MTERKTHFATSTPGVDGTSFAFPPAYQQPPRIAMFSGDEPTPKGEVSFEVWKYEVKCLQRDRLHSDTVISQAIRRSLKGIASRILLS